jgi:hypothetical protein
MRHEFELTLKTTDDRGKTKPNIKGQSIPRSSGSKTRPVSQALRFIGHLTLIAAHFAIVAHSICAPDPETTSPRRRRADPTSTPAQSPGQTDARVDNSADQSPSTSTSPFESGPESIVDYTDPTYGGKIRQLRRDAGHEHNFYYYRDPWNADGSYLLSVQTDLQQKDARVVLHDGDGHYLKELFPISRYDWRLCWDKKDPDILYTWHGAELFRFHVKTGVADLLKSFAPLFLKPNGPSVNQDGDRIVVTTSDKTFHSFHLPEMGDERTFQPEIPEGCQTSWDKPRFTGYRNTIDVMFASPDLRTEGILVYDDTGKLVHRFDGIGGGGHYAFSPDGQLAYFFMPNYPRTDGKDSLDIHVVKLDGTDDRVVFSAPHDQTSSIQNLHLSWPAKVNDWLLASCFHFPGARQVSYAPLFDEIIQIPLVGKPKFLARTEANYSRGAGRGSSTDMFWAMPLCAPQADGGRVCFDTNRSGTVDICILYLGAAPKP